MRAGIIAAMASMGIAFGASAPARASDWGCEVLLCLSNPGRPSQYAACVAPISRLWRALAKGNAFPTCYGAGVGSVRINPASAEAPRSATMRSTDGSAEPYSLAAVDALAAPAAETAE